MSPQFAIGIDLGTTNCVLAWTELNEEAANVRLLDVPQLVAPQTIEQRRSLPSFLYIGPDSDAAAGTWNLPWEQSRTFATGEVARRQSAEMPQRTISAAKSWLCHSKVDRHGAILPWNTPEDMPKLSPVTVSRRYLEHLVAAWTAAFPEAAIANQHVVLTVPASFDASARELTREAAIAAGLPDHLVLIEEPQAATYAWLESQGDRWRKQVHAGQQLLVCDVGGGTTDLTLVDVVDDAGELQLQRRAVGDHLLVGGDNMDLTLAFYVSQLFKEQKNIDLDPWQSVSLWHACRAAKEALLAEDGPDTHPVAIPGRSSRLIGGTVAVDVDRNAVSDLLVNGFFAECDLNDKPLRQRSSGFQELGLPFETDTAVTRHLAAFLSRNASGDSASAKPTHVLFNGGVFKASKLRSRLLQQLSTWFEGAVHELDGDRDLDYSVARGAAYYAWSKHNGGIRIRGGAARSYYIGIETAGLAIPGAPRPLQALCVVPHGMEEGTQVDVPGSGIGLVVGEPARFRFFSSAVRKDQPGQRLQHWSADEVVETDSLEAELDRREGMEDDYVPVRFESKINELGVFELWCVHTDSDARWKLEFSVRDDAEG
ncbi:MAG: Hsp70 family protein [Planctomycetaceae bacterium]